VDYLDDSSLLFLLKLWHWGGRRGDETMVISITGQSDVWATG
jgi:hypothetical protein